MPKKYINKSFTKWNNWDNSSPKSTKHPSKEAIRSISNSQSKNSPKTGKHPQPIPKKQESIYPNHKISALESPSSQLLIKSEIIYLDIHYHNLHMHSIILISNSLLKGSLDRNLQTPLQMLNCQLFITSILHLFYMLLKTKSNQFLFYQLRQEKCSLVVL